MRIIQVDLNRDYSEAIDEAVNVLNYGGTVVYPTDTLYGLGANALNEIAVRKVFRIKDRSFSKPLPMIVRNIKWAEELVHIKPRNREVMSKVWPGAVTIVLDKKEIVPNALTAEANTVGLRVPDHVFVDKLLAKFGYPLTSTSANISGEEGTGDINKIIEVFSNSIIKPDLVIDAGVLPKADPSVVLDLTSDKPKILRISTTRPENLLKLLQL